MSLSPEEYKAADALIDKLKTSIVDESPLIITVALTGLLAQLAVFICDGKFQDIVELADNWAEVEKDIARMILTKRAAEATGSPIQTVQ